MLGNAIGSIFFGLIYLGLPILLIWAIGQAPRNALVPPDALRVIAGVMILAGVSLLAAGGLAFVNRKEYADWRAAQGLAATPRLTAEQLDYDDDRPRRRRRDYDDR
jgi:predicted permease